MATAPRRTQAETYHVIFGSPDTFNNSVLPTKLACCRKVLALKEEAIANGVSKNRVFVNDLIPTVAREVKEIWDRATFPTISIKSIGRLIKEYYDRGMKFGNQFTDEKRQNSEQFKHYQESLMSLLDCCPCKCQPHYSSCPAKCLEEHHKPSCSENCELAHLPECKCLVKIPEREIKFVLDQRRYNRMVMGSVDMAVTRSLKAKEERFQQTMKRLPKN